VRLFRRKPPTPPELKEEEAAVANVLAEREAAKIEDARLRRVHDAWRDRVVKRLGHVESEVAYIKREIERQPPGPADPGGPESEEDE
jgi:hypothetical protein